MVHSNMAKSLALAFSALVQMAQASTPGSYTVLGFGNLVTSGREDPVVSPHLVSGHVHSVIGGNAFSPNMNADTALTQSTCTTSPVKNDLSNYWVPMVYFNNNGKFLPVTASQMNVYYIFEKSDDDMVAFKPGLRMLVGDAFNRTMPSNQGYNIDPNDGPIQPVQMSCPGGGGAYSHQNSGQADTGVGFPNADCNADGTGLRFDVYFPSCYDPTADLADYKNNVQYSSSKGASSGAKNCPPGWLHHPQLHLEVYWDVDEFVRNGLWDPGHGPQPFVLASGDITGYGLHGDFIAGWDEATLNWLIANCDSGDARVDKCPGVPGGISTDFEMNTCSIAPLVDESIWGELDALPGCNKLTGGPGEATPQEGCGATTTLSSEPIAQHSNVEGWDFVGCVTDGGPTQGGTRLLGGTSQNAYVATLVPMSVDSCTAFCASKNYIYAGLEDGNQCWCDNQLNPGAGNNLSSGLCTMTCSGDLTQVCGGARGGIGFVSLYKKSGSSKRDAGAEANAEPLAEPAHSPVDVEKAHLRKHVGASRHHSRRLL